MEDDAVKAADDLARQHGYESFGSLLDRDVPESVFTRKWNDRDVTDYFLALLAVLVFSAMTPGLRVDLDTESAGRAALSVLFMVLQFGFFTLLAGFVMSVSRVLWVLVRAFTEAKIGVRVPVTILLCVFLVGWVLYNVLR